MKDNICWRKYQSRNRVARRCTYNHDLHPSYQSWC